MAKHGPKGPHSGLYQPGQSGNPAGRPKTVKSLALEAQKHGESAIEYLAKVLKDEKQKTRDRIDAAREILNRGYGQAKTIIDAEESGGLIALNLVIAEKVRDAIGGTAIAINGYSNGALPEAAPGLVQPGAGDIVRRSE